MIKLKKNLLLRRRSEAIGSTFRSISVAHNSKPSLLLFIGGTSAYKDASINSFVNVGGTK